MLVYSHRICFPGSHPKNSEPNLTSPPCRRIAPLDPDSSERKSRALTRPRCDPDAESPNARLPTSEARLDKWSPSSSERVEPAVPGGPGCVPGVVCPCQLVAPRGEGPRESRPRCVRLWQDLRKNGACVKIILRGANLLSSEAAPWQMCTCPRSKMLYRPSRSRRHQPRHQGRQQQPRSPALVQA